MDLFLKFHIDEPPKKINHSEKLVLIGSCFSQEIGDKLSALKWNVFQNPTGIIYNPLTIANTINHCVDNTIFSEKDLFQSGEIWHSWQHHSSFSAMDKEKMLNNINETNRKGHYFLKQADRLILTPATSFAYLLKSTGQIVANCHKLPSDSFEKRLLSPQEISAAFTESMKAAKLFNPKLKFIFTISPVKHLRDGVINNNLSKANLLLAVHEVIKKVNDTYYFPSFEIMNDELRDYRFYKNDFAHPNETAVNYIFERFADVCVNNEAKSILKKISSVINAIRHRPKFARSEAHQNYKTNLLQKILELESSLPYLDFTPEKDLLSTGDTFP